MWFFMYSNDNLVNIESIISYYSFAVRKALYSYRDL
jgi:hypothetical protein